MSPDLLGSQDKGNVTSAEEFLRQRNAQSAAKILARLAHPEFVGQTAAILNTPIDPETDDDDKRELFELVYGENPDYAATEPDPLEMVFQNAYSRAKSTEQMIALNAVQRLHRFARSRGEQNELLHVRNLVRSILNRPQPPDEPLPVA